MAISEYFGTVISILQIAVFVMLIREIFGIGYASQSSSGGMSSANTMGGSPGGNEKTWLDSAQEMAGNGVEKAKNQIADDEDFLEQEFPKHFDDEVASILDDYDRAESAVEELSDLSDELEQELGAYRSAHPKTAARRTNLAAVLAGIQQAMEDSVGEGEGLDQLVTDLANDVRSSKQAINIDKLQQLLQGEKQDVDSLKDTEESVEKVDEELISSFDESKRLLKNALAAVTENPNLDIKHWRNGVGKKVKEAVETLENSNIDFNYYSLEDLENIESTDELIQSLHNLVEDVESRISALREDAEKAEDTRQRAEEVQDLAEEAKEDLAQVEKMTEQIDQSLGMILATVTGGEMEDGSTQPGMIEYTHAFDIKAKTKDLRNANEDPEQIIPEIQRFNAKLAEDINRVEVHLNRIRQFEESRSNALGNIEPLLHSEELIFPEIDV